MSIEVCDKTTVSQRAGLCRGSSWAFWSIFSWSFGSSQYKKDPCQRIWSWHEQKECKSPLNGFAIAHECMHQDEVQSALWYREVINFLQVHPLPKQRVKHASSQQIPNIKIKTQLLYLLNTFIYVNFLHVDDSKRDVQHVKWTGGLSSRFKNLCTIQILWRLTEKYNKPFSCKLFATSHETGIVDGVGGSLVPTCEIYLFS